MLDRGAGRIPFQMVPFQGTVDFRGSCSTPFPPLEGRPCFRDSRDSQSYSRYERSETWRIQGSWW